MNQESLTHVCNSQDELISVLYGEASAEDTRQFRSHLEQCVSCNKQSEAFSRVRTSVREFRDQALVGVLSASSSQKVERKSAHAALKAFFDLAPAWVKMGTAFATALLCVFGFIAFKKTEPPVRNSAVINSTNAGVKLYSESELKDAVAKAVNEAIGEPRNDLVRPTPNEETADHIGTNRSPSPTPKSRRPLSRNERQQLAADLRLITRPDDDGLELLGDRINQ